MARTKALFGLNILPVIIAIAVVLLVLYLVSRPDSSPFAKAVQWLSGQIEGFSSPVLDTPKCPGGFRFFNDSYGESFCCKGKINPYTHRCEAKADAGRMETQYTEYKDQDRGGADIACYFDGRSGDFCKTQCEGDPNCKSYNNIHRGGRQEGCCYKSSAAPISSFPGGGVDVYVKQGQHFVKDFNLCAFKEDIPDPRKRDGSVLPTCNSLITKTHASVQTASCPGALPNYGSIGKCCMTDTDLDGYDCSEMDNADTNRYCVTGQTTKFGERKCGDMQMSEAAVCPTGLQKTNYTMGHREVNKYGNVAQGKNIPICFSIDNTCIPDNVVTAVQKDGIYADKKVDGWKYACSGYEKINVQRDTTGSLDNAYIS